MKPIPPEPGPLPPNAQPLVAGVVALSLLAIMAWMVAAGGRGVVDHDAPPPATARFSVDVNTAGIDELAQLPGLGPTMAARVVEHRRIHGPFATPEALLEVPGIGAATLAEVRPYLRPGAGPQPDDGTDATARPSE